APPNKPWDAHSALVAASELVACVESIAGRALQQKTNKMKRRIFPGARIVCTSHVSPCKHPQIGRWGSRGYSGKSVLSRGSFVKSKTTCCRHGRIVFVTDESTHACAVPGADAYMPESSRPQR